MSCHHVLRNKSARGRKSVESQASLLNQKTPIRRKNKSQATSTSKGAKVASCASTKSMIDASDLSTPRSFHSLDFAQSLPSNEGEQEVRDAGHGTINAAMMTPGRSLSGTDPNLPADSSLSRPDSPLNIMTTDNILEQAIAHLVAQDPRLKSVVDDHYCHIFSPKGLAQTCDPFTSLVSGIMAQQVSGAAASSIKRKFLDLFRDASAGEPPEEERVFPTPAKVARCSVPYLRQAGLSERKAEYVQGLAEKFASGELNAEMLMSASDDEIMKKLTAVRGLGKWSVEMFACFALKRMDILSTGDLGVQ